MKLADPDLRDRLAAEYVLGTMKGGARRRFEDYARRSAGLQADIVRWESRLTPLALKLPAIEPRSRVWASIEARLGHLTESAKPLSSPGWWESLRFWRSVGLGSATLATVLLVAFFAYTTTEREPMLTAVLAEEKGDPRVIIEQPKSDMLLVKMVKPWRTNSGFAHQLWVIPKDGKPRSLGIINDATNTKISLADLNTKLVNGMSLAVSLEPPGGSPTGEPTGKVVCKGSIAWMPAKPHAQA